MASVDVYLKNTVEVKDGDTTKCGTTCIFNMDNTTTEESWHSCALFLNEDLSQPTLEKSGDDYVRLTACVDAETP